ncbi:MAG: ABC transporter ATP-binding protein [Planctomycetia bacterium]|nr:ABC transporter ATP-binding protein [Planctomycetia bacterium]
MPAPAKAIRRDIPDPPVIEIQNLSMRFGDHQVLRDISLVLPAGQTLVVIGESGCGKTVLLKAMNGLLRPTLGEVRFEGIPLARMNEHELARIRTRYGFVFQGAALFDSLTIADNIAFPLREHTRLSAAEISDIVESLLGEVGLPQSVATMKPMQLSGGMRKRAGLARALALDPHLILYDEPTTGLDPIMSDVINELILRARSRDGVTSVVVTHDMHTARKVADVILMLYPLSRLPPGEPQVIFQGTPHDLDNCSDPRIRQFIEGQAGTRLSELKDEQARDQAQSTPPTPEHSQHTEDET